jgi:hypothetical protein
MIPAKNQPDRIYHYLVGECCQVGAPVHQAMAMAREGIDKLRAMALAKDAEAIRLLHTVACVSVGMINADHPEYANAVLKWPIVLPQDREARLEALELGRNMRIGSIKAGGKGAPENLDYNSNKGFAVRNLQRISDARSILISSHFDGSEHPPYKPNGHINPWMADEEYLEVIFTGETEIEHDDTPLLLEIRDLPEYCPEKRAIWIDLIVKVLKAHPHLVPDSIKAREKTNHPATAESPAKTKMRGGAVRKALKEGLKEVAAVPGKSWH